MKNITTGLFENKSDYKKLEHDLESSGFNNSNYIIYLPNESDHGQYMISVEVNQHYQNDTLRDVFNENYVLKTFLFENMSLNEASYSNLKKLISARSKAEIHESLILKKKILHNTIDSEVKA